MVNVQDLNHALADVRTHSQIILLIGLVAATASAIMALAFAESTDRSVKDIIYAMGEMTAGNYDVTIPIQSTDEFGRISACFNEMCGKVLLSAQQEREAMMRQKDAEIQSLEAQINPHFLYNTLDSINWVALEREEYKISKMLTNLAAILRYSIHKSNQIVTIGEELQHLRRYIHLQQQRLHYSFQCTIEVEEELAGCYIHKLLLQPLIENAIIHGFPGNTQQDEISIVIARLNQNQLELKVADNGKGMDAALVQQLNHLAADGESPPSNSIGVQNVMTRVQLYYGALGHFHIDSDTAGTTVTIRIPYQ